MDHSIIEIQSEYDKLMEEVHRLKSRIVSLTALRDDLLYHVCPALEAEYEDTRGKRYEVLGVTELKKNNDPVVVYKRINENGDEILACTPEYFTEKTSGGARSQGRFQKIADAKPADVDERSKDEHK